MRVPALSLRRRLVRHLCLILAIAALTAMPSSVAAQFDDDQVKAAFVVNFLKFVTWPEAAGASEAPIEVVVVGADDLAEALAQAAGRQQIGGRSIVVRRVASGRAVTAAAPHIVFIGAAERDRLPALLRQFEGRPVLTVGDGSGYGAAGVVLNFYTSDARIRFEANTTAAARARLQISSHLLRLARIVG